MLCIYVKGSHHFCVFAGGNVCIMSLLSLWWCAPHDFLESTKTTKQNKKQKKKKNSQPTKTRLHCFIAELSTVPLIARRASTYRPFEERALRSSHATLIRETKKKIKNSHSRRLLLFLWCFINDFSHSNLLLLKLLDKQQSKKDKKKFLKRQKKKWNILLLKNPKLTTTPLFVFFSSEFQLFDFFSPIIYFFFYRDDNWLETKKISHLFPTSKIFFHRNFFCVFCFCCCVCMSCARACL